MYKLFGKRLFDLLVSIIGIFILLPVFIFVAILIKLDSRGAVFFKQKRMGQNGVPFTLLKFRTMFSCPVGESLMFEPGAKNRVTRIGRFLRQAKIDEFPQLINVLNGQMSFVGPRPEVSKYEKFYIGDNALVLSIRPGITDNASLKYRGEEELLSKSKDPGKFYTEVILPEKLKINKEYIQHGISLANDCMIILKTILGKS